MVGCLHPTQARHVQETRNSHRRRAGMGLAHSQKVRTHTPASFGSAVQVTQVCENYSYVFSVRTQAVFNHVTQADSRLAGVRLPSAGCTSVHASLQVHLGLQLQLWSRSLHPHSCDSCPLRWRTQLCGNPVEEQYHWYATNPASIAPAGPQCKMISWSCGDSLTLALMSWWPRGQGSRSVASKVKYI